MGPNSHEDEPEEKASSRKRSHSDSGSGPSSPKSQTKKRRASKDSSKESSSAGAMEGSSVPGSHSSSAPKVFTFDQKVPHSQSLGSVQDAGTMTHRNATLDDLCRAVEELEKREQQKVRQEKGDGGEVGEDGKRRPGNIIIPQSHSSPALERERHRFGATPPYTPPPILSPSRSMTMLATPISQPCTPGRILAPWSSRRSSENARGPSESEDYNEPRINIGKDFQAELPSCDGERLSVHVYVGVVVITARLCFTYGTV